MDGVLEKPVTVNNTLETAELSVLSDMLGMHISRIFSDMRQIAEEKAVLDMGYYVFESSADNCFVMLKNEYRHFYKGVDYPRFSLSYTDVQFENMKPYRSFSSAESGKKERPFVWAENRIEKRITDIMIYRDSAMWKYGEISWEAVCDVAIKFSFENEYIMFVLDDCSSAWFVPSLRNYGQSDDEVINRFWNREEWGCKAENPDFFKRTVIHVE